MILFRFGGIITPTLLIYYVNGLEPNAKSVVYSISGKTIRKLPQCNEIGPNDFEMSGMSGMSWYKK